MIPFFSFTNRALLTSSVAKPIKVVKDTVEKVTDFVTDPGLKKFIQSIVYVVLAFMTLRLLNNVVKLFPRKRQTPRVLTEKKRKMIRTNSTRRRKKFRQAYGKYR